MDENFQILFADLLKGGGQVLNALQQSSALQQQEDYSQKIFQFNSQMATLKGQEAVSEGELTAENIDRMTERQVGQEKADYAGGGIVANTGTAALAQEQTGQIGAHNAFLARLNASRQALAFQTQATQQNMEAGLSAEASKNKQRQTIWSGMEGALGDFSSGMSNMIPAPKPNPTQEDSTVPWDQIPRPSSPFGLSLTSNVETQYQNGGMSLTGNAQPEFSLS